MYTVSPMPGRQHANARGLTLDEAFVRMMALGERHYTFTRTGGVMQLLMTNSPADEPLFLSHATNDAVARQDIKRQVCRHGLGLFTVMKDWKFAARQADANDCPA